MWTADAPAKINLHLAVHARRPDGYHALTTVFQTIGLADRLLLETYDGPLRLRCPGSDAPEDETNLVLRAARGLAGELGRRTPDGLRFTLEKRVPAQAGLGGGSADAVAAMRLLCAAWDVAATPDLLIRVGRTLGSDVPFFALGGTVLGKGRGDELTPLALLPPLDCVIVRPPFGVATADAYRWLSESRAAAPPTAEAFEPPARAEAWLPALAGCRNDFEPVVAARHPEIAETVTALRAAGAVLAMMSGSGSAVFGLFERTDDAARAAAPFASRAGWRAWQTTTIAVSAS
jgi:4-diphosphocytidyl-2-C-methyl-D-erythritol kinase